MTNELDCKWFFSSRDGGREDGPNDPMEENFKKYPYVSLIRESIQNSLDAVVDQTQPVQVDFTIAGINAASYPNFFLLKDHIDACLDYFKNNKDAEDLYSPMSQYIQNAAYGANKLHYIKISDKNTKGMDYVPNDRSNPFYAFVRAAGVSTDKAVNNASAGGSFGFGKAAFFYISPIRSIIVSTRTLDGKNFFEGVASLCTHEINGDKKESVGYYDNNNGQPVTNNEQIPARFQRDEPGTNIYIMGIDLSDESKESIYGQMIEAILRHYWLAIYEEKLVATVGENVLSKETIEEYMNRYFSDNSDSNKYLNNYNPRPYFEAVQKAETDSHHKIFQAKLSELGEVRFYGLVDKNASARILFTRRPKMLVERKKINSANGFYGVFVCDGIYGDKMLRKMENPAHNEWKASNWKEYGKTSAKGAVVLTELKEFIDSCIADMFNTGSQDRLTIKGLENYLYIPTEVEADADNDMEALIGPTTGEIKDEGNSLTTIINEGTVAQTIDTPTIGSVITKKGAYGIDGQEGTLTRGKSTTKIKHPGGGGATATHANQPAIDNPDGLGGTYLVPIPVEYRSYAQTENGELVHYIIIYADFDIEDGEIDILARGNETDEQIDIQSADQGKIEQNALKHIRLAEGKNKIRLTFADNIKHALKLDIYEIK